MILRRLTTAFRKQDWFTVAVETLIVVFGVFIGLQVNNWNEARQERVAAHQFELSLTVDATLILDEAREKIAFMEDALEAMNWLQDVFSQPDLPLNEDEVGKRMAFALVLPSHPKRASSITQAVSNSDLKLVRDKDLRLKILKWDSLLQDVVVTQQARREFSRPYVVPIVRLGNLSGVVPFEEAVNDSGSRNDMLIALSMMAGLLGGELQAFGVVEEETEALLELLQADTP